MRSVGPADPTAKEQGELISRARELEVFVKAQLEKRDETLQRIETLETQNKEMVAQFRKVKTACQDVSKEIDTLIWERFPQSDATLHLICSARTLSHACIDDIDGSEAKQQEDVDEDGLLRGEQYGLNGSIGPYAVGREIGSGHLGTVVYAARQGRGECAAEIPGSNRGWVRVQSDS